MDGKGVNIHPSREGQFSGVVDRAARTSGLGVGQPLVVWGGTAPGGSDPTVVLAGRASSGAVLVAATTGRSALVELAVGVAGGFFDDGADRTEMLPTSRVTTAASTTTDLVAVRLPHNDAPLLDGRVLVVAPAGATQIRVTGTGAPTNSMLPVSAGVAVLPLPIPSNVTIEALDDSVRVLGLTRFADGQGDEHIFGESLVQRW